VEDGGRVGAGGLFGVAADHHGSADGLDVRMVLVKVLQEDAESLLEVLGEHVPIAYSLADNGKDESVLKNRMVAEELPLFLTIQFETFRKDAARSASAADLPPSKQSTASHRLVLDQGGPRRWVGSVIRRKRS
jgi:hypothetical protein